MIYSLIFRVAARLLVPLLLLFSVFMLLRGHSYPGGGFVGGLVASSAFVMYALAAGVTTARKLLGFEPQSLLGVGLSCAVGAGLIGLFSGTAFMTSLWLKVHLPLLGLVKLGTTLLFDIGVMLVVIGTVLLMVFSVEDRLPGLVED
ncbi:Na+/H+ antiporter subunit B [Salisaeta longa]|uniref:Na+/H+ antiporter subunit B n=1 Tax=Salisaeta longa TaxID=503170 RepID=UPI0003B47686|nr:Na+/H+ antiporter subunit B [Salisaeta longa]